jgi:hypothetical protein
MKLGYKSHLNSRNKFPTEVFFLNQTTSLPILDELKSLVFWGGGNEEKFIKTKGLEPWIHFKVGGRR